MTERNYRMGFVTALLVTASLAATSTFAFGQTSADGKLKQAKMIIEHDVTENNTGFQAFVDGTGWQALEIIGPNGKVGEVHAQGALNDLGMTEVLMETPEMEQAKIPLDKVLSMLPEGNYEFRGLASKLSDGKGTMVGTAILTHKIPAGATLLEPKPDATVVGGDVKLRWKGSDKALDGSNVDIVGYQLVIDKEEDPHPNMIAKKNMTMFLAPTVAEITIPAAFFSSGTAYSWEVLAIEESGNQTLTSSTFKTQ